MDAQVIFGGVTILVGAHVLVGVGAVDLVEVETSDGSGVVGFGVVGAGVVGFGVVGAGVVGFGVVGAGVVGFGVVGAGVVGFGVICTGAVLVCCCWYAEAVDCAAFACATF